MSLTPVQSPQLTTKLIQGTQGLATFAQAPPRATSGTILNASPAQGSSLYQVDFSTFLLVLVCIGILLFFYPYNCNTGFIFSSNSVSTTSAANEGTSPFAAAQEDPSRHLRVTVTWNRHSNSVRFGVTRCNAGTNQSCLYSSNGGVRINSIDADCGTKSEFLIFSIGFNSRISILCS